MAEGQPQVSELQKKVETLKAASLMQNVHGLIPPVNSNEHSPSVAIIEALKAEQYVIKTILELKGYMFDPILNKWVMYRNQIMNERGIGNFISTVQNISETIEYSSIREEDIPKFAVFLFEQNYPYFTIYYSEYELQISDFNLVSTILFNFIISALHKAKGGGHRNVVRGTYSEDILGKLIAQPEMQKGNLANALEKFNPFKKRQGAAGA